MRKVLSALRSLVLLVSRVVLGLILLLHGWTRWARGTGIDAQAEFLRNAGVPQPITLAWGSTILELAGGVFLIVGALTPLVAAAVVAEQVCIIYWLARHRGPWAIDKGYEYPAALAALALVFVVHGAGRVAVDALLRRPSDEVTSLDALTDDRDAFPATRR